MASGRKAMRYASLQERILANSVKAPEGYPIVHGETCWLWIGFRKPSNRGKEYGVITMRVKKGRRRGKPVPRAAHRVAIEVFKNRRVTPKMVIMHLCNVSICVNPEHLIGGSQKRNVRQTVEEGRHRNGASGPLPPEASWDKVPPHLARRGVT